eukprot:scaffold2696_cov333-Pavlova_lutheri.AAC.19
MEDPRWGNVRVADASSCPFVANAACPGRRDPAWIQGRPARRIGLHELGPVRELGRPEAALGRDGLRRVLAGRIHLAHVSHRGQVPVQAGGRVALPKMQRGRAVGHVLGLLHLRTHDRQRRAHRVRHLARARCARAGRKVPSFGPVRRHRHLGGGAEPTRAVSPVLGGHAAGTLRERMLELRRLGRDERGDPAQHLVQGVPGRFHALLPRTGR